MQQNYLPHTRLNKLNRPAPLFYRQTEQIGVPKTAWETVYAMQIIKFRNQDTHFECTTHNFILHESQNTSRMIKSELRYLQNAFITTLSKLELG